MHNTSCQYEQMPYKVRQEFFFFLIEIYSDGIENAAAKEKYQPRFVYYRQYDFGIGYHTPPHNNIENQWKIFPSSEIDRVEHYSEYGTDGLYSEKYPSRYTADQWQRYGHVGSPDKQKYGAMVEYLKYRFYFVIREGMIQRGVAVQNSKCGSVERASYDTKSIGIYWCKDYQYRCTGDGESGTEPVIRVMVEAESHEECQKYVDDVVQVICKQGHEVK